MKKLEKMAKQLNEDFRDKLAAEMLKRFNLEIETYFSIFSMNLITTRKDGADFTPEEHAFMDGYSEGYAAAMSLVQEAAHE